MDGKDYNHVQAERKLLVKLKEAENTVKTGQEWMTLKVLKKAVEE
ncbi:MAG: type II toxin-antitoxin system Phd/YefM family antitoxin [Anaerocolumna sp.]